MTGEALARITDLTFTISTDQEPKQLVRGVTLSVARGETVGLVGESGSGKSLTARSLLGLTPNGAMVEGDVLFEGRAVLTMTGAELRRYRSRQVAMIFQDPRAHINPLHTVGDFLTEGLVRTHGRSRADAHRTAVGLLEDVGVPEPERRMRQRPYELSGGLLQRVMIAAGLAVEPQLMLADEPTTALDVTTQEEVMAVLAEQIERRQMAMLFITHDLDLAAAVCDRLLVMKDGEIVEELAAEKLHTDAANPYTLKLLEARAGLEAGSPLLAEG